MKYIFSSLLQKVSKFPEDAIAGLSSLLILWVLVITLYLPAPAQVSIIIILAMVIGFSTSRLVVLFRRNKTNEYQDATTDKTTKVYNSQYFNDIAKREMKSCLRSQYSLSVVIFKIDGFEETKKKYGKVFSDQALTILCERIKDKTRAVDIFARIDDNEFVILCPDADTVTTKELAERIRMLTKTLVCTFTPEKQEVKFTCSIAVTQYSPETDREFTDMLARAEFGISESAILPDQITVL